MLDQIKNEEMADKYKLFNTKLKELAYILTK